MPKVPTAQSGRVQEARIAVPTQTRVTPDLAAASRAEAGAFGAIQDIFAEEKRKADQIASLEANSKLAEAEALILSDPETGALNQRGKNAMSLGETVPVNFNKRVAEIESGLTTPEQISSFRRAVAARGDNLNRKIQGHMARERVKFDNDTTNAFIENEANAAAINYNDPRRVRQSLKLQQAAVEDHGERNGLPAEAVKLRKLEVASTTHANVMTKMLAEGDTGSAESYFKKNKKQLTAAHLATIERDIETASVRGKSQLATDKIMAENVTLSDSLDQARAIEDPKIRDETTRRVRQRHEERRVAQRQRDENNYREVSELAKQVQDVNAIPPNKWNSLTIEQQNRLASHVRNLRRGMTPPKNSQTYYDHMVLASSNPSVFLQKNLLEDQDKIESAQMSQLIKMQTDMRQGRGKGQSLKGFETKAQVLDGLLAEIDVDSKAKKGSDREATLAFRQALDERALQFEREKKREPNNNELRELGHELQVEVITDVGFIWDTRKRIFELEPGEQVDVPFSEIPVQDVAKIREAIQRQGVQPTDQQVVQLYTLKLQRIRTRGRQ
jgi:hypothetical protein